MKIKQIKKLKLKRPIPLKRNKSGTLDFLAMTCWRGNRADICSSCTRGTSPRSINLWFLWLLSIWLPLPKESHAHGRESWSRHCWLGTLCSRCRAVLNSIVRSVVRCSVDRLQLDWKRVLRVLGYSCNTWKANPPSWTWNRYLYPQVRVSHLDRPLVWLSHGQTKSPRVN